MFHKLTLTIAALCLAFSFNAGCKKKDDKDSKTKKTKPVSGTKVTANPDKKGPRIKINVDGKGYSPSKIEAKAGDAVLVFTRTADTPCAESVKVAGIEGKTKLPLNKPVEIGVHLPKSGKIKFACGMDMMTGVIAIQ